uniref:Proteasome assembly chaperone 1 n=1 Tax=Pyramimonas obovata TaxID=1411642 RepID=A0A7S0WTZ7_9CHLO|mmetsp:Transcript_38789/g.84403  ORF Transcript_38789/g.84403 Transcript_38789/m.84403 type:complete len:276 (+) Transcript_38789:153-980(+)
MGDIDHLTDPWGIPSRGHDEDEEREMELLNSTPSHAVLLNWTKAAKAQFKDGKLRPKVLIIGTSQTACLLIHHMIPGKTVAGSVVLPEISMRNNTVLGASLKDKSCFMYTMNDSADVLVIACQYPVPGERAQAWTKAVLGAVSAERIVVLGRTAASALRSCAPPPNGLLTVQTDAYRSLGQSQEPFLPAGSVMDGLPAAIVQYSQARGAAARALSAVEAAPVPDTIAVEEMATALSRELQQVPEGGSVLDLAALRDAKKSIEAELSTSSYATLFA